jgi:hypothetical protein
MRGAAELFAFDPRSAQFPLRRIEYFSGRHLAGAIVCYQSPAWGGRRSRLMDGSRIALPLAAALACAIAALAIVPRGIEAKLLLGAQDDPVKLADHALDRSFNAAVATNEIEIALKAGDAELAQSFLDLAHDRRVTIDGPLVARVEAANAPAAVAARAAGSFAQGLVVGEPNDLVGFTGTALGDLFVFGDIRDAVREGTRLASGEPADKLILGLAGVGIAITAGTYASYGIAAPARVGLSLLKAARKTGRLTTKMGHWLGRSLRETVDWAALRHAVGSASLTQPVVAVRMVRSAVKAEKSRALMRMVSDVGRVQSRAGTQAALDGVKLSRGPRDVARVARLADVKGTRTRAILKLFGRGALFLTASAFSLAWWVLGALFTVLSFVAALKRTVERATERYCERRRAKRAYARDRSLALTARA